MFQIRDYPGVLEREVMRQYFERAVRDTAAFAKNTPLAAVTINDAFSHYADPDTDTMWIGFAIGMRCAERLLTPNADITGADRRPG